MRLHVMLLTVFSLAGCGGVPRPDVDLCVVNAPGKKLTCYNMLKDYDAAGSLKKDAKPHFKPAKSVEDLNKGLFVEVNDIGPLKGYMQKLREAWDRK